MVTTISPDGSAIDWGGCTPGNYSCLHAAPSAPTASPSTCGEGYKAGSGCHFDIGTCVGGVEICPFGAKSILPTTNNPLTTNPLSGIPGVDSPEGRDTLIRIALFIVGVILIAGGVHGLTGVSVAV